MAVFYYENEFNKLIQYHKSLKKSIVTMVNEDKQIGAGIYDILYQRSSHT